MLIIFDLEMFFIWFVNNGLEVGMLFVDVVKNLVVCVEV